MLPLGAGRASCTRAWWVWCESDPEIFFDSATESCEMVYTGFFRLLAIFASSVTYLRHAGVSQMHWHDKVRVQGHDHMYTHVCVHTHTHTHAHTHTHTHTHTHEHTNTGTGRTRI